MMWGIGGYGALWMLLFWGSIALLIAWTVQRPSNGPDTSPYRRAEQILAERYAQGEIDLAEYDARSSELARSR
ncbi:MAG: hypothetical protein KJP22_02270 [Acidimicrobiia bacterium]|nr:hypothetical protein [Acidimicrobiia bacterium]NNL47341.1 hypothetical protein [Acidimicrobiia bacterium]